MLIPEDVSRSQTQRIIKSALFQNHSDGVKYEKFQVL